MRQSLDDILSEINVYLLANSDYTSTYYEEAVLQDKDGQTWPLARIGTREQQKISPTDTTGLQVYHRQIEPQETSQSEVYRGVNTYVHIIYHMRLIAIGARKNLTSSLNNVNQDICNHYMQILGANARLSQGEQVFASGATQTKVLDILNEEYAGNESVKKYTTDLIAFGIDYGIKQIRLSNNC